MTIRLAEPQDAERINRFVSGSDAANSTATAIGKNRIWRRPGKS